MFLRYFMVFSHFILFLEVKSLLRFCLLNYDAVKFQIWEDLFVMSLWERPHNTYAIFRDPYTFTRLRTYYIDVPYFSNTACNIRKMGFLLN
jgi:hypothetical protein